jgi:hypothetical protein
MFAATLPARSSVIAGAELGQGNGSQRCGK